MGNIHSWIFTLRFAARDTIISVSLGRCSHNFKSKANQALVYFNPTIITTRTIEQTQENKIRLNKESKVTTKKVKDTKR